MKKSLKRVLSVLLAVAMLLGMSVTSFAAENPDTGEAQSILRGPAKPITSITLIHQEWDKSGSCFDFTIEEQGIGSGTVTFDGTKITPYKTDHILSADRTEVIGWIMHYKSPRIYRTGTYKMEATFLSANGTPQIWKLKHNFTVTEDMLY